MAISAAKLMVEVGANTSAAERGIDGFGKKLNNVSQKMGVTGGIMTAAITAPLLGIAGAALKSAGDFEQNMNVLQQVVGASGESMAAMQAQALELGAVTSFSAGEAAGAMLELGKAGMSTEQIMASIGGVMDLAAAGGVSLAEAASLTAATLNAFHLEASESTRVADLLAGAANASAADISDLGQGMQQAGFAFQMANQPVENLAASLAILTNVGLTGSDAGTALKNAFMRMMNPTQEAASLMDRLGISFYDAAGNMKALPDIIDNLNVATAGLSNEERDAALATIFLSDGMKAMIPLMDQGKDGFDEMVTSISKTGAATDVAGARMKGLSGGIEYLKGSVDSFLIGAALPFLGTLGDMARGAGDLLTEFGALPQPIIDATLAFAGILAATGPLMLAISGLTAAFAFLISPIGLVVAATAGLAAAWAADVGGIQGITAKAMGEAQRWFTSTATAAHELAASIQTAFSNTSFPSLESLLSDFKAGDFQALAAQIKTTAFELMVNLDTELNITGKADQLKARLVEVVNSLSTAISNLDFSGASANFDALRDKVQAGLSTAFASIDFGPAQASFSARFGEVATSVGAGLTTLMESAKNFDVSAAITNVQTGMASVRDGILSGLTSAISGVDWAQGGATFSSMISSLSGAITNLDFSAINWTQVFQERLMGPLGTAIKAIQWVMDSSGFSGLVTAVQAAIASINWGEIASALGGLGVAIGGELEALWADMVTDVTTSINNIDWSTVSLDTVAFLNSLTEKINSIDWTTLGTNLATSIKTALTSSVEGDTALTDGLVAAIKTAISEINWGDVATAMGGLVGAIGAGISDAVAAAELQLNADLEAWLRQTIDKIAVSIPDFDWTNWVEEITWPTETINAFAWTTWVHDLIWPTETINGFSWTTWVDDLTWPTDAISGFDWATFIEDLTWPGSTKTFSWSTFVDSLHWNIPSFPGWDYFFSWFGGPPDPPAAPKVKTQSLDPEEKSKTKLAPLGGSTSTGNSLAMAGGDGITVNISATIGNDMDLEVLAHKLAQTIQRKMRL